MNLPSVKKAGSTAAKFASGTAGAAVGTILANKIPVPAFGPAWLQEHMQKALPGLAVMVAAYVASAKFKSKHDLVEPAAIGMGIAGFAKLVRAYAPEFAAQYVSLQGPYVPPGMPDMNYLAGSESDLLQYQLGKGAEEMNGNETLKLTA